MPCSCAAARPSATAVAISDRRPPGEALAYDPLAQRLAFEQLRDRKESPPSSPKSWIARMLGCERAATARASRSKRDRARGSPRAAPGSTLIATSRPSRVSRARYTSPIPPAPSGDTIS